jgi:hypothetical protein
MNMKGRRGLSVFLIAFFLITVGAFYDASADHHRGRERKRHQKRYRNHSEHYGKRALTAVTNATYKEKCGACHFAYQPGLLPSGSWKKVLSRLEDHFGEAVEVNIGEKKIIAGYLEPNAAEYSSAKRSIKIMKCLGSQTPMRITEIGYVRKKHREIRPEVFKRKSIGSFSNCIACHKTAEKGIYDDDHVSIPK